MRFARLNRSVHVVIRTAFGGTFATTRSRFDERGEPGGGYANTTAVWVYLLWALLK